MMERFLNRVFWTAMTIVALFSYPAYISSNGYCSGDTGTVYDDSYLRFFTHTPEFKERAKVTNDFRRDLSDSTVLVIGDSFSQLGSRSFTSYLQHYLSGWQVLTANTMISSSGNLWQYVHASLTNEEKPLIVFPIMTDYVIYLLENADTLPKTIVMETSERFVTERFANIRTNLCDSMFEDYELCKNHLSVANAQQDRLSGNNMILSESNLVGITSSTLSIIQKWWKDFVGIQKPITLHTATNLFSAKGYENILFLGSTNMCPYTLETVKGIKNSIERLHALAEKRDVKLYFFICPEKYHLYMPYLTDAPKCNVTLFHEVMAKVLPRDYYIDNYTLLDSCIESGMQDIYISTDTHWSHIAADITAKNLANRIQNK